MDQFKNKWVLITGASSGFGKDYAHIFAKMGANLILTARRTERLEELKSEILGMYQVSVESIPCDLAEANGPDQLYKTLQDRSIEVEVLINNAGLGVYGAFSKSSWSDLQNMLQVDIMALTHLTKLFLTDMMLRNRGYILLVASIAGYQPSPYYAAYAASKAYVLNLGEALNQELKDSKVRVSVLSPGATDTEFLQVAGQTPTFYQKLVMMKSYPVAMIGVKAMVRGTPSIISGLVNKISVWSLKLIPRAWQAKLVAILMK